VIGTLEAARAIDPMKADALEKLLIQTQMLASENVLVIDTNLAALCSY
jgi:hypothetical protein